MTEVGHNGPDPEDEELNNYIARVFRLEAKIRTIKATSAAECKVVRDDIKDIRDEIKDLGYSKTSYEQRYRELESERQRIEAMARMDLDEQQNLNKLRVATANFWDTPLGQGVLDGKAHDRHGGRQTDIEDALTDADARDAEGSSEETDGFMNKTHAERVEETA